MDAAPFDGLTADFVRQGIGLLWGAWTDQSQEPDKVVAATARYTDVWRGQSGGHDVTWAHVFCLIKGNYHGGPGVERPGSACAVRLASLGAAAAAPGHPGRLLPLLAIGPHNHMQYPLPLAHRVPMPDEDFNRHFEVSSAHHDYAVALVTPLMAGVQRRDNWAFLMCFDTLVAVSADQPDPGSRIAEVIDLVSAIPPDVVAGFGVAAVPPQAESHRELSDAERTKAKAIIDEMTPEQRRAIIARLRTEGPDAVFAELLS
jgi:hypothetical protein